MNVLIEYCHIRDGIESIQNAADKFEAQESMDMLAEQIITDQSIPVAFQVGVAAAYCVDRSQHETMIILLNLATNAKAELEAA